MVINWPKGITLHQIKPHLTFSLYYHYYQQGTRILRTFSTNFIYCISCRDLLWYVFLVLFTALRSCMCAFICISWMVWAGRHNWIILYSWLTWQPNQFSLQDPSTSMASCWLFDAKSDPRTLERILECRFLYNVVFQLNMHWNVLEDFKKKKV